MRLGQPGGRGARSVSMGAQLWPTPLGQPGGHGGLGVSVGVQLWPTLLGAVNCSG